MRISQQGIFMPLFSASQTLIHLPRLAHGLFPNNVSILGTIKRLQVFIRVGNKVNLWKGQKHNSAVLQNGRETDSPIRRLTFFFSLSLSLGLLKTLGTYLCLRCKIIYHSHFMCII